MRLLKNKLNKILEFIEDKNDVIFIDFPLYHNIGDLLILSGTVQFFKNNNINIKSHLSVHNTNVSCVKSSVTKSTTIICQGGGNFGDIYDIHQILRENIIKAFPNNRVIILPQTAFFSESKNKEKSKNIFRSHNNVIMFARDKPTYDVFKEFSDHTYLMPDMAHELYDTLPKSVKEKPILYFLRNDIEVNPTQLQLQKKIKEDDYFDWSDWLTKNDHRVLRRVYKLTRLNKKLRLNLLDKVIFKIWSSHSEALVHRMSKKFSSYDGVVTSRLHGHILSCLVDVPSSVVDNSYGKNIAYYELWTKDLEIASIWNG
ncbi:polysaccharide pyruvyl transferase family protein [Psychrobacter sp. PL19]|uniref:polysaccharide pyruvyl transferase family protein n=1 Tax=Psychrobacter sp. PL19 TaxID=2760711 RepID=UPI002FEFB94E